MATKEAKEEEIIPEEELEKRKRSLTLKGRELFYSKNKEFCGKIEKLEQKIYEVAQDVEKHSKDFKQLKLCRETLNIHFHMYNQLCSDHIAFLSRSGTTESDVEYELLVANSKSVQKTFDKITKDIDNMMLAAFEVRSAPAKSTHSHLSQSLSLKIAEKRAKAEAAKTALEYVTMESELIKKQALIETEKTILEHQKRYDVLNTEVKVLEEESIAEANAPLEDVDDLNVPVEDAAFRTAAYVDQVNTYDAEHLSEEHIVHQAPVRGLNPLVDPFDPSRLFLRKELLLQRLTKFDDSVESYLLWKSCFKDIIHEVKITAAEEVDLLLTWLGPMSARYAKNIRKYNVANPKLGLRLIWERLDDLYGSPEMVLSSVQKRIDDFQAINVQNLKRLYDLYDLLSEIDCAKHDVKYALHLAYFDSPAGVNTIIAKLPVDIRCKWESRAFKYKEQYHVTYPPFAEFVCFVHEMAKLKNDPCLASIRMTPTPINATRKLHSSVQVRKTDVVIKCPLHNTDHLLNDCISFRVKPYKERIDFMKKKGLCFKCTQPNHLAKDCKQNQPVCKICNKNHLTALHMSGSERTEAIGRSEPVLSKCTEVCEDSHFSGKSCGKTLLVTIRQKTDPDRTVKAYAIVDDQSNSCLAKRKLFELMNVKSESVPYSLSTCAGTVTTTGRRAEGLQVVSLDGKCVLDLPTIIECDDIPDHREEIASPTVAFNHDHLRNIAKDLPPLDTDAEILLLIGRNLTDAFHVLDQRLGPSHSPFAQRLPLGWVIIGETCLRKQHPTNRINVHKTFIMTSGRPTVMKPCQNNFIVKESSDVFVLSKDDDKPGLSIEDNIFLDLMDKEMYKTEEGNWSAPLPLRNPRPRLPNNKPQAVQRAQSLHHSMIKDSEKRRQLFEFMQKIFKSNHAEVAPRIDSGDEVWYLPLFGVRHPKKKDQIRGVFYASAAYEGISLNSVLLQGPDLANKLIQVLLAFRKEPIAVMGDIEKMFYCFKVPPGDRNFLRFLWYRDNDFSKDLIEYRMTVHVFGNKSSPAVASYGLRKIAAAAAIEFGEDVQAFVHENFYVDDGLTSLSTPDEAIDLLKRTQAGLMTHGNVRFHKISSNSAKVMEAISPEDRSKDLQNINIDDIGSSFPVQRSLGVSWNVQFDMFMLQVSKDVKPFTKRGVLSTIGSVYDPLGFCAPVVIEGKLIMRELLEDKSGWDDPLPSELHTKWDNWRISLEHLETVSIPRTIVPFSFKLSTEQKLLIYCDASEKTIAAVAYLQVNTSEDREDIGFVMGKVKLAPSHGHTVPRLELCAAVIAVELAETVCDSLNMPASECYFYSDSRVVLGYIRNKTRKFKVYVSNRISRILKFSDSRQWFYISTSQNPADSGTRGCNSSELAQSRWLEGPKIPHKLEEKQTDLEFPSDFDLSSDSQNQEQEVISETTHATDSRIRLGTERFLKFSSWKNLVSGVTKLKTFARNPKVTGQTVLIATYKDSEKFIIREVRHEIFAKEIQQLKNKNYISKDSPLFSLNPFLDSDELLRVGGRLNKSNLNTEQKNPIILPKGCHVSKLITLHFHENVKHQGRLLTEGAVRSAGYWIIGGKRMTSSLIHKCVSCRKLRSKVSPPKMADLSRDQLTESPPFSFVGLDTFGPWNIVSRRTRGGLSNSKRWAILFTCLVTRAVHIEVVEELTSSAFINALKRFIAIRGDVCQFHSDRGTNFVGSVKELNVNAVNVEDKSVKTFLKDNRAEWIFNPPHASHMGGAWERLIGVCRKILDSILSNISAKHLTHDVLVTLMAEVCSIVNNRPIVPVSSDPDNPCVLSPAVLLTQKLKPVSNICVDTPSDMRNLYKAQWLRVQQLADMFWARWRSEYLQTLQCRRKWQTDVPDLQVGDVVLMKDKDVHRNNWPMAVVEETRPSSDGRVRIVLVRTSRNGRTVVFTRPVTDLIPILRKSD